MPKVAPPPKVKLSTHLSNGQVVIESEFTDRLDVATNRYLAEYQPKGITELTLVKDLAMAECRADYALTLQSRPGVSGNEKMMAGLARFRTTNLSMFKRALKMLKSLQRERQREADRKPQLVKPRTTA